MEKSPLSVESRKKCLSSSQTKSFLHSFLSKAPFFSFRDPLSAHIEPPLTDKRKSILLKEKDLYLKSENRPSLSNITRYASIYLLSLTWNNEYLAYLEGTIRKMLPVNSDIISKETNDVSRCLKRGDDKYGLNEILRPELKISDFMIIDEELMDYLINKYHGYRIKREILKTSPHLEYFPLKVFISNDFFFYNSFKSR